MFTDFYYTLRGEGVKVAITEWLTLMQALELGLALDSLTGFYYLARSVLIKSESQYDAFDRAFLKYFAGVETPLQVTEQVLKWLENSLPPLKMAPGQKKPQLDWDLDELRRQLADRLEKQDAEHHGGSKWIGTGGRSPFGHSGYNPAGVRIGGQSVNRSAVKVAAERNYRDFRTDETLTTRQFELALRKLRLLSTAVDGEKDILDLDATVDATGRNAGRLELIWARSRKNRVKLLVLMDSGGSMDMYHQLCGRLFNAANKSTHFRDLQFYFFHNCVYEFIYPDPLCRRGNAMETFEFLRRFGSDYRLVIVGDASMAPSELIRPFGAIDWWSENEEPGINWMQRLAEHFEYSAWLNPIPQVRWKTDDGAYTINLLRQIFPMYDLTIDGLNNAIKALISKRSAKRAQL